MYFIIFYNRLFSNTSFTEPLQKAEYKIYKISYSILRTFFKRKGLTNKTTNWLNMVVNPTPT
jgi:hypothetical protein